MTGVPQLSIVTGKSAALATEADSTASRDINNFFITDSQKVIYAQCGTSKIRNAFPVWGCGTVKLVKPKMG
ncbi:TPA: hypothetical protein MH565_24910 [Klebsiella pneumoniae]|uniref:Uncharacterized protein n=4 Tax=Enterobacteriaceae TaxID=543 RepID=A0AAQ2DSS1_ECOLX|nr:hypothetical protein CKO_00920 [Citrobacter koseri ATCC BAA-895]APM06136.1 hypothetical protein BTE51_19970 [Klebsiella pneumoniae]ATM93869.1 hypothetical protein CRN78_16730 [Klebsiella aerogenes]AVP03431.1 hypothetical protein AM379_23260 [Enterobacter cloacae complex sp. FDA-CDC-AR_0132]AWY31997.1 hypothetical protein DQQ08_27285 [Klebsiella pneumoniae subsp. pneumoniae]EAB6259209.1 hypothetical protein [Escherichia coli]EBG5675435.1 hypothetical protein [Salmonella enterica subsp. ente